MTISQSSGARLERIAASPRWDGTRFRNSSIIPRGDPGVPMPALGDFICGGDRRVPQAPLPALWGNIHLGPAHALAAHTLLGGGPFLPVHRGTFNLALHPWDERLGEPVEPSGLDR
jgi:hypothetical protein